MKTAKLLPDEKSDIASWQQRKPHLFWLGLGQWHTSWYATVLDTNTFSFARYNHDMEQNWD